MSRDRKMRWFDGYIGRYRYGDFPFCIELLFLGRPDLMTKPEDEGRMPLAVLDVRLLIGPTYAAIEDGRWWRWVFRPLIRSDVSQIAARLAGGVE